LITQSLSKVIANFIFFSWRKVDLIIRYGKVLSDLSLVQIMIKVNPNLNNIYVNGKELKSSNYQFNTILLNKANKSITTSSEKQKRKLIIDLQRVNLANILLVNHKEG